MNSQTAQETVPLSARLLEQEHQLEDAAVEAAFRRLATGYDTTVPAATCSQSREVGR